MPGTLLVPEARVKKDRLGPQGMKNKSVWGIRTGFIDKVAFELNSEARRGLLLTLNLDRNPKPNNKVRESHYLLCKMQEIIKNRI